MFKSGKLHPNKRPEIRKKISDSHKGLVSGMKDKRHSTVSNEKNRQSHLGKKHSQKTKDKMKESQKNRIFSEEHRKKLKEAWANRILTKPNRCFNTKPELKVVDILNTLRVDFKHPYRVTDIEHAYSADFYIPSLHLIIEVDGKYWHNYPVGNEIDHIRTTEMTEAGYNILRVWEDSISFELLEDVVCIKNS